MKPAKKPIALACSRLVLALSLGCALPVMAAAAQDAVVAEATAKRDAGDIKGAYALLMSNVQSKAGDPGFDYLLGITALDDDRPGEAIIALQRVLAVQPDNAQARAELARAYAMSGDIDTAKAQFETVVQDPTIPDPVRRRFNSIIGQYDREIAGGGSSVSGFVDLAAGHDSNINSATQLTSITIPLFAWLGPGQLGGNSRAIDDQFTELQAGVSGVHATGRQDRVFGSVLGNWRNNLDSSTFDQSSVTATAGYAHTFASRNVFSVSAQGQQFWFGGDSYRSGYGAIGQYTRLLPGGRALSFGGQYYRFDYKSDPLRDAQRMSFAVTYSAARWVASLNGGRELALDRAGDANSNRFAGITFGLQIPVSERVAFVADGGADMRRYEGVDALFLRKRDDRRVDVSAGFKWAFGQRLQMLAKAGWSRNDSNIPLYEYRRWTAQVGLRYEF